MPKNGVCPDWEEEDGNEAREGAVHAYGRQYTTGEDILQESLKFDRKGSRPGLELNRMPKTFTPFLYKPCTTSSTYIVSTFCFMYSRLIWNSQ